LVIDDDLLIAWAVEEFLRRRGYRQVIVAASDAAALHAATSGPFDLIVSDVNLGTFSHHGLAVLRQIDPQESMPTVILTGYQSDELEPAIARYRPRAVLLRKPASDEDLSQAIASALAPAVGPTSNAMLDATEGRVQ
jgi:CheY-like chemotaxis protein